jgi:hypothetical protein
LPSRENNAALACIAFLLLVGAAPAPNADELVRAATEAPKHISYVGEVQSTRWGPSQALATIVRIEHKAPDSTRRTYLAPQSVYGEYTITRGAKTYDFDVHRQPSRTTTISHSSSPTTAPSRDRRNQSPATARRRSH